MKAKKLRQLITHHLKNRPGCSYNGILEFVWRHAPKVKIRQIEKAMLNLLNEGKARQVKQPGTGDIRFLPEERFLPNEKGERPWAK